MGVLVIEDEQQVSAFIKQGLEEQSFEVDVAYDGSIGERLALSRDYDVILLDIVIPGINGFDLRKTLKNEKPNTPILMLTTLGTTAHKVTEFFMRNPGRVIPRTALAEKVWDIKFETGTNVVDVYINMLRNKTDRDFDPKLLHTRIGLGYVLSNEG